jgi:hypothetical protein
MDTGVQTVVHARPQAHRPAERTRARPAPGKSYQAPVAATGVADLGLLNPQTILSLQASAGNAAVASLLATGATLQRQPAAAAAPAAPPAAGPTPRSERQVILDKLHADSKEAAHQITVILKGSRVLWAATQVQIMEIIRHWATTPGAPNSNMSGMDWLIAGLRQNTYEVGWVVNQTTSAFDELHHRMDADNVAEFQRLTAQAGKQFKNEKPIELAKFEVTQEDIIRGLKAGGELAAALATGGGSMVLQIVAWLATTLPGLWNQLKAVFSLVDAIKGFRSSGVSSKFSEPALGVLAVEGLFGEISGLPVLGGPEPPKAEPAAGEASQSGLTKVLMMIVHGITVVKSAYNKIATKVNGIIHTIDISQEAWLPDVAAIYAGITQAKHLVDDPLSAFKMLVDKAKEMVGGFFDKITGHIGEVVGGITEKLGMIAEPVKLIGHLADRLVSTVLNFIITHPPSALLQTVFSVIQTAAGADLIDLVRKQLKPVGDEIIAKIANSDVVQTAIAPIKGPVQRISEAIGKVVSKGLDVVKGVQSRVAAFLNPEKLKEMTGLGSSFNPPLPVAASPSAPPTDFLGAIKEGLHSRLMMLGNSRLVSLAKTGAKFVWGKVKAGAKAAYAGIKGALFGEKATYDAEGEQHEVWAEEGEQGRAIMVASTPAPLAYKITGYDAALKKMSGKSGDQAEATLDEVKQLLGQINNPDLKPDGASKLTKQLAARLGELELLMASAGVAPLTPKIAYEVDGEGRPLMARGGPLIALPAGRRDRNNSAQRNVMEPLHQAGLPTDKMEAGDLAYEAAHLIADSLGGSGAEQNLVPATYVTNQSWSKILEGLLAETSKEAGEAPMYGEVKAVYPSSLVDDIPRKHRGDAKEKMEEEGFAKFFAALKRIPDAMEYRIWRLVNGEERAVKSAVFDTENRGNLKRATQVAKDRDFATGREMMATDADLETETLPKDAPPDVMGWGDSIGSARDRLKEIEAMVRQNGADGAASKLRSQGITKDVAQQWMAFYQNEVAKFLPGAPKRQQPRAQARLDLAQRVVEILSG